MNSAIKFDTIKLLHDSTLYIAYYKNNIGLDFSTLQLSSCDRSTLSSVKGDKRRLEFQTTRVLFATILPDEKLIYSMAGAPIIESNSCEISISHSASCVAIMVSQQECGLDVEELSRDFAIASNRFITENDIIVSSNSDLAAVWVTKEAIYKAYKGVDINIFYDIIIKHLGRSQIISSVRGRSVISHILIIDSIIISYVNILNIK